MPYLYPRQNPLDSARNTFSSWDNCMAKSYCKWPVIVAIVVGSLIVFSVVFCIARCICCGAECAICCCKCCTCCCSGGGGRSSGHKRMKSDPRPIYPPTGQPNPYAQAHAAAPPAPPIDNRPFNQQYRSHATPAFTPAQEAPQFATFESNRKPVNEDSLPAMPSWGDARDVHVQVEEPAVPEKRGDVEMDRLNHTGSATNGSMTGMAAAANTRRSPGPGRSPIQRNPSDDSYGYNQGFEKEPLVGGAGGRSPQPSPVPYNDRPYAQQDDYLRRGSPAQNLSPVYGANDGYSRRSPQPQPYDTRDPYSDTSYNTTPHQNTSYAQMPDPGRYDSPPPPSYHTNAAHPAPYDNFASAPAQGINRTHTSPTYDNYAPAPAPAPAPGISRTHTSPTYDDHVDATPASQPVSAYPGQRSYTPQASAYPGQQSYQAFNPGQTSQQYSGVSRKAVDGSYREI